MKKWKLVKKEPIFTSQWLSLFKNSYKLPDGSVQGDYLQVDRPDYVVVIALDEGGKILVERQYRRGVDDFVYELPAGWVEPGEKPIDAALRELREETGCEGSGEVIAAMYAQPGFCSMKAHVAVIAIKRLPHDTIQATKKVGGDERIECQFFTPAQVREMMRRGKIKDMGFVAAVELFLLKSAQ